MDESRIFTNAVKLASPAERAAYLDQACVDRPALRAGVEALLRAHDSNPGFLEQPAGLPEGTASEPMAQSGPESGSQVREEPGLVLVGQYKLLEQIGEGGMGTVWMAQQTEPVKRLVAVKLIKAGLASKTVLARFEAERQALALMDHPNIAKVLGAGTAPDGSPFFAMDLVKGIPITRYCDEHRLTPRQRLELFVPVCEAVQHAHQKGIIHRDLKPSNVLVAQYDERPAPKVIDFGVAKATGQALTEESLYTGFGAVVGTVEYMSPEQASFNQLDVDTRSDIYSLGVLLYELLTGSPPFSRKELEPAGMLEMLRVIREQEPTRPSTKLSTAEGLPTLAASRGTEPKRLTALVRGELDWLVMKALEKDRNRRYGTASALAADVQHYLADEPVLACPHSAWYRVGKFARRNRVGLLVGLLIGLVILSALGGIGVVAWDRAQRRERILDQLHQLLDRTDQLYRDRKLPEALAEAEIARGLLEASGQNPGMEESVRHWSADLAMARRLEEAQLATPGKHDGALWGSDYAAAFREYGIDVESLPPSEAALRIAASRIRADLVPALDAWALSLPEDSHLEKGSLRWRLHQIAHLADSDPWDQRYRQAAESKDVKTLRAMAQAADLVRTHASSLAALGFALRMAGASQDAISFLRRAQRQHPANVSIMLELIHSFSQLKPYPWDEVVSYHRAIVAVRPKSPAALSQLGRALYMHGKVDEAVAFYHQALQLQPDYPGAHLYLGELMLFKKFDFHGAIAEFSRVIAARPGNGLPWSWRGLAYLRLGQRDKAIADLSQAIRVEPKYGPRWGSRGSVFLLLGEPEKARADFAQEIALWPDFPGGWTGRAEAYLAQRKYAKALADCAQALKLQHDVLPAYRIRGAAYMALGQWDKAVLDFSFLVQRSHQRDVAALTARASAYQRLGQLDKALADLSRVLVTDPQRADVWIRRARVYGEHGKMEQALADFSKAIQLDPHGTGCAARGRYNAETGRWKEAVADLEHVRALEPDQPAYWYDLAMAQLGARDKGAYGRLCRAMQEHFWRTRDTLVAAKVVSTSVVAPEGIADPDKVLVLAERAASGKNVWNERFHAAALIRGRQSRKALEYFEKKPHIAPRAWDWLFRAMAHQRLGEAKEARECLAHAKQWIEAAGKAGARVPWFNWQEEVAVRELRTQAETMIGSTAQGQERAAQK